jgi:hypothetical protein
MIGSSVNINKLLELISRLDYSQKIDVVESILGMLKQKPNMEKEETNTKLSELKGLGAEIWKNTNVEKYIQEERRWE